MVSLRTRQCCSSILTSGKETIENWFKWNKSFCQKNKIWILHYHLPLSPPIFGGGSGFWPFEIGRFPPFWAVRLCKCNITLVLVFSSVIQALVPVPFSSFLSCEPLYWDCRNCNLKCWPTPHITIILQQLHLWRAQNANCKHRHKTQTQNTDTDTKQKIWLFWDL